MKVRKSKNQIITELSSEDRELLTRLASCLSPFVKLPPIGKYKGMTANRLWMTLVGQVCVMGASRLWENAMRKPETKKLLSYSVVSRQKNPKIYLQKQLKNLSATRFPVKSGEKLARILVSDAVFSKGRVVLFQGLSHDDSAADIRDVLMRKCPIFKLKSASDFMISVGLSNDVVAIDARLLGFFEAYCGLKKDRARIQSHEATYLAFEAALREQCSVMNVSLGVFDRLMYSYAQQSVAKFLFENPEFEIVRRIPA